MKKSIIGSAVLAAAGALLLTPAASFAQTIINNNNNITINNGGGNGNRGGYDAGQAVNWRNDSRMLDAWMYTDRTNYRAGTGVQIRLTLTNLNNGTTHIQLPRKGEYTISITDTRTNRVVWSRDKSQSRGGSLQLNGNGTAQWTEFWDQRDGRGNMVPMGAYRIDARVLDALPLSAQVFLTERGAERPQPGNGGIVPPDPPVGPGRGGIGGNPVGGFGRNESRGSAGIRGNIVLSKPVVRPGDVLRFTYTVVNTTQEPVTLTFGSAQLFDAWATTVTRTPSAARVPVWRFSEGMAWAQMVQQVTLQPGAQRVFQGTWRIPNTVASGQSLDVSASLTPIGGRGTVGTAVARIDVN